MKILRVGVRTKSSYWEEWDGTRIGRLSDRFHRFTSYIWACIHSLGVSALFYLGWGIIIGIDILIHRHRVHGLDW